MENICQTSTHPSLIGKLPVALCDQLNREVAVIDLSAPDPTSQDGILWVYKTDNKIDEAKLRYSNILNEYLVCMTSSKTGVMRVVKYPSGELVWESIAQGFNPHSIEYLPNGHVACALAGTGGDNQEIRIYPCQEDGSIAQSFVKTPLCSVHGLWWDNEWELLWALGHNEIAAYKISGDVESLSITRMTELGCIIPAGSGHDLSMIRSQKGKFFISSDTAYVFDKYSGTLTTDFDGSDIIGTSRIKSISEHSDCSIIRTVAANVYRPHNTNVLDVFKKDENGNYQHIEYCFAHRAFYKARPFILN